MMIIAGDKSRGGKRNDGENAGGGRRILRVAGGREDETVLE